MYFLNLFSFFKFLSIVGTISEFKRSSKYSKSKNIYMHFRTSSWRVIEVKGNDWPASRPGKKRKGSCRTVDGGGGNSSSGLSFRSQNQVTTTSYPPTLKLLENSPLVNSCGSLLTLQRHKESLERKRGQGSSLTLKFHHLSKAWTQVALAADLHPTPTPAPQPTKSISPSIDWSQLNNPPHIHPLHQETIYMTMAPKV